MIMFYDLLEPVMNVNTAFSKMDSNEHPTKMITGMYLLPRFLRSTDSKVDQKKIPSAKFLAQAIYRIWSRLYFNWCDFAGSHIIWY